MVLLSILIINNTYAACTGSSPTWYCTPDYTSLNNLIKNDNPGTVRSHDTINVSAGTATWNSPLVITKGLILKGSGIDNTIIISNITDQNNGIITYKPATPALNESFRITGFTFDCNNMSNGILLSNNTTTIINKVRIDHNKIINPGGTNAGRGIYILGTVYGVIDNNRIEFGQLKAIDSYGINSDSWENLSRDFGSVNNIYYEDNIFIGDNTYHSSGHGGRYVSRYNEYSGAERNLFPVFDMHGNQPAGYATMVGEIYGNKITLGIYGGNLVDQRGGQAMIFNNYVSQTANQTFNIKIREEYDDSTYPSPNSYLMHVTNSYYWNNRRYLQALTTPYISQDMYDSINTNEPLSLEENREFYTHNPNYNGTTQRGVYCGLSLPSNCTTGDAAWITTQTCSSVEADNVGRHPKTPISGNLYKCTATDTWTFYYTPYTYPHPLTVINPSPPLNLTVLK